MNILWSHNIKFNVTIYAQENFVTNQFIYEQN